MITPSGGPVKGSARRHTLTRTHDLMNLLKKIFPDPKPRAEMRITRQYAVVAAVCGDQNHLEGKFPTEEEAIKQVKAHGMPGWTYLIVPCVTLL